MFAYGNMLAKYIIKELQNRLFSKLALKCSWVHIASRKKDKNSHPQTLV